MGDGMADDNLNDTVPAVTLGQARAIVEAMAHEQSILLLSPPGTGKSETVLQAASGVGLPCRSLLGTQIAPEDVSGIPRIVGERSVFCPPRILLPESAEPFCLFLDELPACSPDVQKSFYSLLLERRLGEHRLPGGTWVVAAGNRAQDRSLVRSLSAALVNRVIILNIRVDMGEWLAWAKANGVRADIRSFIILRPDALTRPVPPTPTPFSTPRSWASLSAAIDRAETAGILDREVFAALAFGRVSPEDAAIFTAIRGEWTADIEALGNYIRNPKRLPSRGEASQRWFLLHAIREHVRNEARWDQPEIRPKDWKHFFAALSNEEKAMLLLDLVPKWGALGLDGEILRVLQDIMGEPHAEGHAAG